MDNSDEEVLIYLEFSGMLHEDIFNEPNLVFKTLGFETENPILQIGEEIYEGEYDYAKGTNLFFEEDPNPIKPADPVFSREIDTPIKYVCKTNKILRMNRIFLKEKKKTKKKNEEDHSDTHSLQSLEMAKTYEEALEKISDIAIVHMKEDDKKKIENENVDTENSINNEICEESS